MHNYNSHGINSSVSCFGLVIFHLHAINYQTTYISNKSCKLSDNYIPMKQRVILYVTVNIHKS